MASPIQEIVQAQQLGSSAASLYQSPTSTYTRIDKVSVSNPGTTVASVTLYLVPSGFSPGSSNATTNAQAVVANGTFNSPNEYGHVLNPGDAIWGLASTSGQLVIAVAGTQVTG